MTRLIHARDLQPWGDQRTVATVCGKRASVNRCLSAEAFADLPIDKPDHRHAEIACVGCRAILIERARELQRARDRYQQ